MGERKALAYTEQAAFYEEALLTALQVQFDRQLNTILMNIQTVERSLTSKTKDYVTEIISWESADADMGAALQPHLLEMLIQTGQQAIQDLGLNPSLYDPYSEAVQLYLEHRSTKIAEDVNDETEKQLRATLTEGINAGESTYQIRARIELVMGIAATMRADTITRTEVARAQSAADIYAWNQSGVVEAKQWYTTLDERRCPYCKDLHGRIVALDENYFDKGDIQVVETTNKKGEKVSRSMHHDYDDVPGCPLHPRCRCTLVPVRATTD